MIMKFQTPNQKYNITWSSRNTTQKPTQHGLLEGKFLCDTLHSNFAVTHRGLAYGILPYSNTKSCKTSPSNKNSQAELNISKKLPQAKHQWSLKRAN